MQPSILATMMFITFGSSRVYEVHTVLPSNQINSASGLVSDVIHKCSFSSFSFLRHQCLFFDSAQLFSKSSRMVLPASHAIGSACRPAHARYRVLFSFLFIAVPHGFASAMSRQFCQSLIKKMQVLTYILGFKHGSAWCSMRFKEQCKAHASCK